MYMHTHTQRLRAGLSSHAASGLGQPSDFKISRSTDRVEIESLLLPFCVTRLQLLVFWTKFFGAHIPLLAEEGWLRHPKNGSVPICRGRGGQCGAPSKGQPN